MDRNKELDERKMVRRKRMYDACINMIMAQEPMPDTVKAVFNLICHESVEQIIYNAIIYEQEDDDGDNMEKIEEKGARLYYIHTKFNQKLNRSDHIGLKERDEFLLDCIVSEIKRRKKVFRKESRDVLKDRIYMKYEKMNMAYIDGELLAKDVDGEYEDFDEYVQYLFKIERNGIIDISSINHLWNLLGRKRDQTFRKRRPSKDELYMFCFALALDYKTYCRMKRLLLQKMEKEGTNNSRKYKQYSNTDKRDMLLWQFLENIDTRLLIVRRQTNNNRELIPNTMIKSVNYDLNIKNFPLLKIGRRKRRVKGREGEIDERRM